MAEQNQNDQDQRTGGYGGSSGGQDLEQGASRQEGSSAAGREGLVNTPLDGDEALGNRTGGYGGNPSSVEEESTSDQPD